MPVVADADPVVVDQTPVEQEEVAINDPVVVEGYANAIANVPVTDDPDRPKRRKK